MNNIYIYIYSHREERIRRDEETAGTQPSNGRFIRPVMRRCQPAPRAGRPFPPIRLRFIIKLIRASQVLYLSSPSDGSAHVKQLSSASLANQCPSKISPRELGCMIDNRRGVCRLLLQSKPLFKIPVNNLKNEND